MKQLLFLLCAFLLTPISHAQNVYAVKKYSHSITNPKIEQKKDPNLHITNIDWSDESTEFTFVYNNISQDNKSIYLDNSPESELFIQANRREYRLKKFWGIGTKQSPTIVPPGRRIEFHAEFEGLPINTKKLDLIEGRERNETNTFSFFGVQLQSSPPNVEFTRIVRDYNATSIYDSKNSTWNGPFTEKNTIIFNANDQKEVYHISHSGEVFKYKIQRIEKNQNKTGKYQEISLLNENRNAITIILYSDEKNPLLFKLGSSPWKQFSKR